MKIVEISVLPEKIQDRDFIKIRACKKARLEPEKIRDFRVLKRSIDARGKHPVYKLRCEISTKNTFYAKPTYISSLTLARNRKKVIVVGAGPAGYFAALELIKLGLKPIVLERGKAVRERRRDLRAIQQEGIVDQHSNYCFGEGGAGTYSDGKLYTRSHKRGNISKVLEMLVEHGASTNILVDAHPHIGSNKLPQIVSQLRETIETYGGEVHFGQCVTDFVVEDEKLKAVVTEDGSIYRGEGVILATGHSARSIYYLLDKWNLSLERKPFALGVRIEHSQSLIDKIQYNQAKREANLPASSYKLACQIEEKGVFSFCMCPGGLIVPAATAPGEIVVNGMSLSRRDSPFANSGFVTEISNEELLKEGFEGKFGNLEFQRYVEQKLFKYGDGSQRAPAQRVLDFVNGKLSESLNDSSYIPGLYSAPLHELLPSFVVKRLQEALKVFGRRMKGYLSNEANVVGVESRTSATIKIPREAETLMHPDLIGLYPCGEGAGYAGGILSACMDGQRVARAVAKHVNGDKKEG